MSDLPARAARAGVDVRVLRELSDLNNSYKTVFCDAPCSGSGTWRRDPMGKWALTADRLGELVSIQYTILVDAASRVAAGGSLVYATCSVLSCENQNQVTLFCETHPDWGVIEMHQFVPTRHGDGFFVAHLSQKNG
jgi:16S rRNA (cytosine967-C5)-methyltransferase